jgi:hypothetical protein
MAQAEIQAARAAETTTQRKFGVLGGIRAFNPAAQKFYESQKQAELRRLVPGAFAPTAPAAGPLTSFQVPSQAAPSGGAGAKGPKPPEDRTALLQEDLEAMKLMSVTQDGIRDALFEGNKELAIRLEYDQKVADINRDTAKALLNANYQTEKAVIRAQEIVRTKDAELDREDKLRELARDKQERIKEIMDKLDMELIQLTATTDIQKQAVQFLEIENQLKAQGIVLTDQDAEAIRRKIAEIQKVTKEQKAAQDQAKFIEQQFAAIGAGVGDLLTNAFDNLISKTKDWNDVLRDSLMAVGRLLMMAGLNLLAGTDGKGVLSFLGFGGGFGARAAGGPVTGGKPYIVGERGPELFLPSTGGNVMSNNDLRSAMGSNSVAAGAPVLNMSFQTTNIGGVEYVSRDQLEQAMAATRRQAASDGAKRGMTMTLDKLQQSPGTRSRVGLR